MKKLGLCCMLLSSLILVACQGQEGDQSEEAAKSKVVRASQSVPTKVSDVPAEKKSDQELIESFIRLLIDQKLDQESIENRKAQISQLMTEDLRENSYLLSYFENLLIRLNQWEKDKKVDSIAGIYLTEQDLDMIKVYAGEEESYLVYVTYKQRSPTIEGTVNMNRQFSLKVTDGKISSFEEIGQKEWSNVAPVE